ncbi:uncharacterized protein LOC131934959 isoform X2 [Physella acuta]|uniref:uncharacterized protein LOC131934959 isoform X2 n=1 Tax=Physella acuta TaxID=109671 RepID=UPI0027DE0705|nr:uncharacterized protein LOC131934959 isoform X2 [Physella acuta]
MDLSVEFRCDFVKKSKRSTLVRVLNRCLLFNILLVLQVTASNQSQESSARPSSTTLARHARVLDMYPVTSVSQEGQEINGFLLKKVLVVVSPGLRIPPDHIHLPTLWEKKQHQCKFRETLKLHKSEKFESFEEILSTKEKFKRKSNSAFKVFKFDPETCRGESLSAAGVLHMIHVGEHLSKVYLSKLKSLQHVMSQGLAESVGDEVLFHSMNALLYGLLTEKQFIHSDVVKVPSDFHFKTDVKQPQDDLHFYVAESYKQETHLLKSNKLSILETGMKDETTAKEAINYLLNQLYPKLVVRKQNNQEFDNSNFGNQNKDLHFNYITNIFNSSDTHHKYLTSNPLFHTYAVSLTYPLRQHIKNFILSSEDLPEEQDMKLLAVDELLMLSLLASLNLTVSNHLMPGSRLVFETYEPKFLSPLDKPEKVDKLLKLMNIPLEKRNPLSFVRVLYNGKVISSSFASCGSSEVGFCHYSDTATILDYLVNDKELKLEL